MMNKAFHSIRIKTCLILIALFLPGGLFSQELSVGGAIGSGPLNERSLFTLGAAVEYRPLKSMVSFNIDPFLVITDGELVLTGPLYLKFSIGNKIRFCPAFGGFFRTNGNYGWMAGLAVELSLNNSVRIFVKGDYYKDYWKAEYPSHFGANIEYIDHASSYWISAGCKIPIHWRQCSGSDK
jgi:hypothetical protein